VLAGPSVHQGVAWPGIKTADRRCGPRGQGRYVGDTADVQYDAVFSITCEDSLVEGRYQRRTLSTGLDIILKEY